MSAPVAVAGPELLICCAMHVEAWAVRRAKPRARVLHTGYGTRSAAADLGAHPDAAVAVTGVCGATGPDVSPGDVVVATEVLDADQRVGTGTPCPSAPLLANALRRIGCRVHCGPVRTLPRLSSARRSGELGADGVLAVDLESVHLARAAGDRPLAVARVVVDTPERPLGRVDMPWRGAVALARLAQVTQALQEWGAAVGSRELALASPRSFCAGVDRAIETVERALAMHGRPVYVRRQIVHNQHVVDDLRARGAVFVQELDEVPAGRPVVLSAHGVAPVVRRQADERGLQVIDATCPLVAKVHVEARRLDRRGDSVVLIGHAGHEEAEGTLGELGGRGLLVQSVQDAEQLEVPDPQRVSYLMQTTLSVEEAADIVAALTRRFPAIVGPGSDDICYATSNRQQALAAVADRADLVLVVGSGNSSNSRRLVEVAQRHGTPAHLVEDVHQVDPRWLPGVRTIGISAGASAPPTLVQDLVAVLSGMGPTRVEELATTTENVRFTLPKEVSL